MPFTRSRKEPITVAVTGLNATDNPGPGVSVLRSVRADPDFRGRIVGLAYDALEPGIYAEDLVDDVFIIPYPSQGIEAFKSRLCEIHARLPLDVIIPNLDAELSTFIALKDELARAGMHQFIPTAEQFDMRSKANLMRLGEDADLPVPRARIVNDAEDLVKLHEEIPYPFMVKGLFYGAEVARGLDEAVAAYWRVVAKWGLPVIVQEFVGGDEFDVVAVGDGEGGLVGAVAMRKTFLTDKGKGWAGIAVYDPALLELTERFMRATKWRGPCEVEIRKEPDGTSHLLEVNPRFPAWTFLSAGAGMNLPMAVVRLALGDDVAPMTDYEVGTMFVRIALDQIAKLSDLELLSSYGEIHRRDDAPSRVDEADHAEADL